MRLLLTRVRRDIPGVKQEDINLEIDGPVVRVRRAVVVSVGSGGVGAGEWLTQLCFCSADYKVPDEYSGDDIKWHRAGRPFGCVLLAAAASEDLC